MWPKLDGLVRLQALQSEAFGVLPFVVVSAADWRATPRRCIAAIVGAGLGETVVVRSCVGFEDATDREPAGFFESVLNVPCTAESLGEAIDRVVASYARRKDDTRLDDMVIVQKQLEHPRLCGVCLVEPETDAYIEVDVDDSSGRTDSVTSGLRARRALISPRTAKLTSPWSDIRRCADALRPHFPTPFFFEFAVGADSARAIVFQIRPDRRRSVIEPEQSAPVSGAIEEASCAVETHGALSVMTDWNPAEILGPRPLPLDISLYDHLLMCDAWAEGRMSLGWCAPDDRQLMTVVAGRPFIKIRQSLKSLLPDLPAKLADRLVADRLGYLNDHPDLHDKVEFRVMWSAFAFDNDGVANDLRERNFSHDDVDQLFDGLRAVTRNTIDTARRRLADDLRGTVDLSLQRSRLTEVDVGAGPASLAQALREALDVCRTVGAVPFSRQARMAFSFRYIVNRLVDLAALSPAALARWQAGLNTITRRLSRDASLLRHGSLGADEFMARYGHLRPSTYDLESLRYDERAPPTSVSASIEDDPITAIPPSSNALQSLLDAVGSNSSQSDFWRDAAGAYTGREDLKFHFTALLSDILKVLALAASIAGLKRRTLRLLPVECVLDAMDQSPTWSAFHGRVTAIAEVAGSFSVAPCLPDLILKARDLDVALAPPVRPTFVSAAVAHAPPHLVEKNAAMTSTGIAGSIVMLEAADPGYDWVFAQSPAGLVTAYGGEFSHMGLRCAEFGIPAAIGCGKETFALAAAAKTLKLDSAAGELWADGKRLLPV